MVADPQHIEQHHYLPVPFPLLPDEWWLPLPTGPDDEFSWAAPFYHVSTLGRVFWYAPDAPAHRRFGLKALRPDHRPRKKPHLKTNLHVGDEPQKFRTVWVHRLVLATWAGPHSDLTPLGRHKNGDGLDNKLSNLVRGTHSENMIDQYALGERTWANQYGGASHGCPF